MSALLERSRKNVCLTVIAGIIMLSSFYAVLDVQKPYSFEEQDWLTPFPNSSSPILEFNETSTKQISLKQPNGRTSLNNLEEKLKIALQKAQEKEYAVVILDSPAGKASKDEWVYAKECGRCLITFNRSKLNESETKAIVFHYNSDLDWLKTRRSEQLYVWWAEEPPSILRNVFEVSLQPFDGVFNLTMTYRRDSDVYYPYQTASEIWKHFQSSKSGNLSKDVDDLIGNKKKLSIWLVSNCKATYGAKRRMAYVKKLVKAGLDLDRRGRCFWRNGFVRSYSIVKNYKFYLAFENSVLCKDYITEKLFRNGFKMGAVPVVMGAAKSDYEAVVPPGSCIYVDDFESPEKLVEYLNYLDENTTAYKQYFKWRMMKREDMPQHNRTSGFCNLCRILHGINVDNIYRPTTYDGADTSIPMFGFPDHPRVVPSLGGWYYNTVNPICLETALKLQQQEKSE